MYVKPEFDSSQYIFVETIIKRRMKTINPKKSNL